MGKSLWLTFWAILYIRVLLDANFGKIFFRHVTTKYFTKRILLQTPEFYSIFWLRISHRTVKLSSFLHSVNLILFTVLLVHLILRLSPHHSHHLHSHHLSLPQPFTPDLKLISFTNPFLHSHSYSFWTAFTDLNLY